MIVTYKNSLVLATHYNVKRDEYYLYDQDDNLVDVLKRHEFLSHPMLRNLPNGRYRGTNSSNNRGASNQPSGAGGVRTIARYGSGVAIHPGGLAYLGPSPSLARQMGKSQMQAVLFGIDEPAPKPPLRRDVIVAGEIVAFRCWIVERGLLRSVYQPDVWYPGEPLQGRELEDWGNRGIHAWKDPASQDYHNYIRAYLNQPELDMMAAVFFGGRHHRDPRPAMVTGTVFLWGDVVEHTKGYRAEFARVRSLDWLYPDAGMMGREREVLDVLRSRYGV